MRLRMISVMLWFAFLMTGCSDEPKPARVPSVTATATPVTNWPRDAVNDKPQDKTPISSDVSDHPATGDNNQVPPPDPKKAAILKRLHPVFLAGSGEAYARMRQEDLEALTTEQPTSDWIVQLDSQATRESVDAIKATGATVLGGLARGVVLVRNLDPEVVRRQPHVAGMFRFYDLYKLDRETLPLVGSNAEVTINVYGKGDMDALRAEIQKNGGVQGNAFAGNGFVLKTRGTHLVALAKLGTVAHIAEYYPIVPD